MTPLRGKVGRQVLAGVRQRIRFFSTVTRTHTINAAHKVSEKQECAERFRARITSPIYHVNTQDHISKKCSVIDSELLDKIAKDP